MKLNERNYFSKKAEKEYMSVSQFKAFEDCQAAALAMVKGKYKRPKTTALLVGSYVDSYFEGTLEKFRAENPELFKKDGTLKSEFIQAEDIIKRCSGITCGFKSTSCPDQLAAALTEALDKLQTANV